MALSFAESLSSTAEAHGSPPGAVAARCSRWERGPPALWFLFKETSSVFTVHPAPPGFPGAERHSNYGMILNIY